MMEKRLRNWSLKITPSLHKRLRDHAEKMGIHASWAVNACMYAICDYIETYGEITFPLVVVPRSRWEQIILKEKAEKLAKDNEIPN